MGQRGLPARIRRLALTAALQIVWFGGRICTASTSQLHHTMLSGTPIGATPRAHLDPLSALQRPFCMNDKSIEWSHLTMSDNVL